MFTGAWTVLVTPFKNEGDQIDFDAMSKIIAMQIEGEIDGLVVGGTTGESPTLNEGELLELTAFVVREVGGRIPILMGTGTNCTKKTVEMTMRAKDLGVDGAFIIVPYYNRPTDRGVKEHFHQLNKLNFPLVPYHHPGRTGIRLKVETLVEIASLDNVVAIKDCTADINLTKEILLRKPDAIIFSGDDDLALQMLEAGARGAFSVISNVLPNLWKEIIHTRSKFLYQHIEPLILALLREVNPQGIKCAMSLRGLTQNLLRLPLVPVLPETKQAIQTALQSLNTTLHHQHTK